MVMNERERRLGLENAKLALRIHKQRHEIRVLKSNMPDVKHWRETLDSARRQVAVVAEQNQKLIDSLRLERVENKALKLLILNKEDEASTAV